MRVIIDNSLRFHYEQRGYRSRKGTATIADVDNNCIPRQLASAAVVRAINENPNGDSFRSSRADFRLDRGLMPPARNHDRDGRMRENEAPLPHSLFIYLGEIRCFPSERKGPVCFGERIVQRKKYLT